MSCLVCDQLRAELAQVTQERDEMKYQLQVHADLIGETEHGLRKQLAHVRAALKMCVDAWMYEGEPSAIGYEIAIDKAQQALGKGQP